MLDTNKIIIDSLCETIQHVNHKNEELKGDISELQEKFNKKHQRIKEQDQIILKQDAIIKAYESVAPASVIDEVNRQLQEGE